MRGQLVKKADEATTEINIHSHSHHVFHNLYYFAPRVSDRDMPKPEDKDVEVSESILTVDLKAFMNLT